MKSIYMVRGRTGAVLTFAMVLCFAGAIMAVPCIGGVVTSTADAGPGTLRQEILDANADGVPTLITFDAGVFPAVINLTTRLPAVRGAGDAIDANGLNVIIDGTAVPDAAGQRAIGIRAIAANVTVRGLTIRNFANDGIYAGASSSDAGALITQVNIAENRVINNLDGIHVSGNAGPNNLVEVTIANNRLVNNRDDGITVEGSQSNSPGQNEVRVVIDGNRIRGSLGVITGGTITGDGIRVLGGSGNGSDNQVLAEISNNLALENIDDGIVVAGAGGNAASNNSIEASILNNVVKNNGADASLNGNGIVVRGGSRSGAVVAGNFNTVLFDVSDNRSVGNKDTGIAVSGGLGTGNTVEGNVTSNRGRDNGLDGLRVTGGIGTSNHLVNIRVKNNRLIDNLRDGINVNGGSGDFSLLEHVLLADNRASWNDRFGILVTTGSGTGNTVTVDGITGNRAFANARDGLFVNTGVPGTGSTAIDHNRCSFNAEDGLDIDSTGYALSGNRAMLNAVDGISAMGNTDGGGNVARGNAFCNTPGCF